MHVFVGAARLQPCRHVPMPHVRVPASCVLYVPEAQGSLPREGAQYERCAVRLPASGVPYVPRTVAPQVFKVRVRVRVSQ